VGRCVPEWAAVFFILMSVVGLLEGMQIAFFAVAKIPASERGDSVSPRRPASSFQGEATPGFMIGRQLCSYPACSSLLA
jgi:hypothetical protein